VISNGPIVHHPLSFHIGPVSLTGFGIAVMLGFVVGQLVGQREIARRGFDPAPIGDVVIASVLGFLVGAKLYYLIVMRDWSLVFTRTGFVFWGGLVGGIVAAWVVIRRKKLPFLRVADVAGPGIAAGYAVGRTGCWAVGDDYGRPWNGPLAVVFPEGSPPSTVGVMARQFGIDFPPGTDPNAVVAVHPTQLYQTGMALVMFFVLWHLRDHKHAQGWLFGAYCVAAGIERFIAEFFRAKDDRFLGPFTVAQAIAVGFIALGVAWLYVLRSPSPNRPGIYRQPLTALHSDAA
jgi:phosphatidylglycerol---prolipoprotein diacylglyceryl transferase